MSTKKPISTKEKEKIWVSMHHTLKLNNDLICNNCQKKCDEYELGLLIDYENRNLIDKTCGNCIWKIRYGTLNRKEKEFVAHLEDIYNLVDRLTELKEMNKRERCLSINDQLKILKNTCRDMNKEAIEMGLKDYIR